MISRDVSPNRPVAPQFPPGSPFEDFFEIFLKEEGFLEHPPPRQRRNETAAGSGLLLIKMVI